MPMAELVQYEVDLSLQRDLGLDLCLVAREVLEEVLLHQVPDGLLRVQGTTVRRKKQHVEVLLV